MEKFLHAISRAVHADHRVLARLWSKFGDWRYIWEKAGLSEIIAAGIQRERAERLVAFRGQIDADAEFAALWERDVVLAGRKSREYPDALKGLPDAPFLLYRKGAVLSGFDRMVAIVGTRNPSLYGEKIAYELAEALSGCGITVVSGLAFGIDAVAHFSAVSSKKPTVAVLASGLYDITPSTHHRLSEKILEHGGSIVSEYPPDDPAYPVRFLERNRIIAGLCEATVVIEAGEKSGALVTARLANEYNRDVYAVPGDITRPQAAGCLKLIRDGAHPLVSIADFLSGLGLDLKDTREAALTIEEKNLIDCFRAGPCTADQLSESTRLPIEKVNVIMANLEMKGLIRNNRSSLWETTPS